MTLAYGELAALVVASVVVVATALVVVVVTVMTVVTRGLEKRLGSRVVFPFSSELLSTKDGNGEG